MKPNIVVKLVAIIASGLVGFLYFIVLGGNIYEAEIFPPSHQKDPLAQDLKSISKNILTVKFLTKHSISPSHRKVEMVRIFP